MSAPRQSSLAKRRSRLFALAFTVAFAGSAPGLAAADCYDVFGCTDRDAFRLNDLLNGPNCDFLYTMRNAIYKQHGYCFKTQRAIATFGNEGCVSGDANRIGLSALERGNAATILKAESIKGCTY